VIAAQLHHAGEIAARVGAGLLLPRFEPHGHTRAAACKTRADRLQCLLLKPNRVDRGAVFGQGGTDGFGPLPGLRPGVVGARTFDESRSRVDRGDDGVAVFVKPRGKPDGFGRLNPPAGS